MAHFHDGMRSWYCHEFDDKVLQKQAARAKERKRWFVLGGGLGGEGGVVGGGRRPKRNEGRLNIK